MVTVKERIEQLEGRLDELIDLLKFFIRVDQGLTAEETDLLIDRLEKLKE